MRYYDRIPPLTRTVFHLPSTLPTLLRQADRQGSNVKGQQSSVFFLSSSLELVVRGRQLPLYGKVSSALQSLSKRPWRVPTSSWPGGASEAIRTEGGHNATLMSNTTNTCVFVGMQNLSKHASMQACKHASMQACKHASMQACMHCQLLALIQILVRIQIRALLQIYTCILHTQSVCTCACAKLRKPIIINP